MLRELRISQLGVIESASVEFAEGLTALTGETGAGKTMVTTGIGLVLGERAETGLVRRGARSARVEGRFDSNPEVRAVLTDLGGDEDDDELLVARQVSEQGRSRAWIGGVQAPAATLARVVGELVTIHGQSEQQRLTSPERQRDLLDRSCGPEHLAALERYRELYLRHRSLQAERDSLLSSARERAREADLLRFGCEEVAAVSPVPGEDQRVREEAVRLQSLDELRTLAALLSAALSGSNDDLGGGDDGPGVVGLAGTARRAAEQLAGLDDQARTLADQVHELVMLAHDVAADAARYEADLEVEPGRLDQVMERQAALARLTRKYGSTVDEVLDWADQARRRLATLEGSDERVAEIEATLTGLASELTALAEQLGQRRRVAAASLADRVQAELAALALPHARLTFHLDRLPTWGPHGHDQVQLVFSANPGSLPGPLGRVASGGELSRVRLALEVVLAESDPGHTFVFDEVDAGVGGAVALEIGRRLARLARHSQVVVVTHLAQVAAFADRQVVVSKASAGQVTTSGLSVVEGVDRERELARMMGGLDADSAQAHARDLLREAQVRTSARS